MSLSGKKSFAAIRDVTEKLKIEDQLIKSREQLFQAQKMEALGTLVAGVAHEINNPINLIMYNIPLMKRIWRDFKPVFEINEQKTPNVKYGGLTYQFIDENLDQLITDMDLAAKRVETIVRRLKDFSRKSNIFEKFEMSVNEAVENALCLAQSTLKKSKVIVQTGFLENIPLLKGHLQSIEQVVLNLLINAIDAIDHDHGEIQINTSFLEIEKTIIVQVQDNGKGMSTETREKIFDPFFTEKQADGGTGLGLSVSYSLIKSHEGEITCQSEPGKGALFEIRLPLEPQKKRIKVLIADDDPALRKLISQMLKREGEFLTEVASHGTEALIKLGTFLPDVLILDLFMPQMNGLEVCQAIIKEKKLAQMKVIIITGMPDSPEIKEIKKIGFMNIYSKPLDVKTFARDITGMFQKEGFQ
jgi:signal transduction histidine kinase/CheY-like chemotaxis protein